MITLLLLIKELLGILLFGPVEELWTKKCRIFFNISETGRRILRNVGHFINQCSIVGVPELQYGQ